MTPESQTSRVLRDGRFAAALALGTLLAAVAVLWQAGPGSRSAWSTDASDPWAAFVFDGARVQAAIDELPPAAPGSTTVIAVADPGCVCTRRSEPHRMRVRSAYAERGVRFVAPPVASALERALLGALPATPAVVVLDAGGRVAYAGPWSNDGTCLAAGGAGPVEDTLEALLDGAPDTGRSPLGVGCLCATPGTGTTTL